ncbi:hypothetical protein G7046_g132 [Stylonectria norvegica]|nr:hypothetical protein G7046_g132 [Stylonectria norvegica]
MPLGEPRPCRTGGNLGKARHIIGPRTTNSQTERALELPSSTRGPPSRVGQRPVRWELGETWELAAGPFFHPAISQARLRVGKGELGAGYVSVTGSGRELSVGRMDAVQPRTSACPGRAEPTGRQRVRAAPAPAPSATKQSRSNPRAKGDVAERSLRLHAAVSGQVGKGASLRGVSEASPPTVL